MQPKVSVIVCTFNQQSTLPRALDSVLAQQAPFPFEVIVGEDCSTDGTLEVARRYQSEHPGTVRVIANERNKGLVANYYDCILQARGEYIADCAGDDFWTSPSKLARQAEVLDSSGSIALCHTAWAEYDEVSGRLSAPIVPSVPALCGIGEFTPRIVAHEQAPSVHLCTALYRADMARRAIASDAECFRSPWLRCEDLQLIAALSSMGKVAFLPEPTLAYSVGRPSLSSGQGMEREFDFYLASARLTRLLQIRHRVDPARMAPYYRRACAHLLALAFNLHDHERRFQALQMAEYVGALPSPAARIHRLLSSSPAAWTVSLALKNALKSLSR